MFPQSDPAKLLWEEFGHVRLNLDLKDDGLRAKEGFVFFLHWKWRLPFKNIVVKAIYFGHCGNNEVIKEEKDEIINELSMII